MQAAAVHIEGRFDTNYHLTFRSLDRGVLDIKSPASVDEISNFRRKYFKKIREIRHQLGSAACQCSIEQAQQFIQSIINLGADYLFLIAGGDVVPLSNLFVDQLGNALLIDPGRTSPPLVEIHAPRMFLPLEVLPLLSFSDPKFSAAPTPSELKNAARAILGMTAIIRRIPEFPKNLYQSRTLNSTPLLPIKLFQHSDLSIPDDERAYFAENANKIRLDGPWPFNNNKVSLWRQVIGSLTPLKRKRANKTFNETPDISSEDIAKKLASYLMVPDRSFDGRKQSHPDQIQHFSCHCAHVDGEHIVSLKGLNGAEYHISMGDLQSCLVRFHGDELSNNSRALPLIFMNACSSNVTSPDDITSYETLFSITRHLGLIATQTPMPNQFAATFSKIFYDSLLSGRTVGESLHDAKWELLDRCHNPLGLLYNLYGDPDLSVSHPFPMK